MREMISNSQVKPEKVKDAKSWRVTMRKNVKMIKMYDVNPGGEASGAAHFSTRSTFGFTESISINPV